jgi:hypothetical protein
MPTEAVTVVVALLSERGHENADEGKPERAKKVVPTNLRVKI